MPSAAIISSKGQVTLPAALRAQLGLAPGSRIVFEARGKELVIKPDLPVSAFYGMLRGHKIGGTEIPKEPDREL